jgi:hypothetical protein
MAMVKEKAKEIVMDLEKELVLSYLRQRSLSLQFQKALRYWHWEIVQYLALHRLPVPGKHE